jgi:uncharacterized membrane protein YbaN (DUF454 family)
MRALWTSAGIVFLAIGVGGLLVPLVPTTPFLLVAAWCFGKGSPQLRARMVNHRTLGPVIADWEAHRVIPPSAKLLASFLVGTSTGYVTFSELVPWWAKLGVYAVLGAVLGYVWTRPSRRPEAPRTDPAKVA